jgi:hypothetical protein
MSNVVDTERLKDAVGLYVQNRDEKARLEEEHKKALAPLNHNKAQLTAFIIEEVEKLNGSYKTDFAVVSLSNRGTAKIADSEAFTEFLLESKQLHLLKMAVSVENLRQYVQDNEGELPPGVELSEMVTLSVRKPANKKTGGGDV